MARGQAPVLSLSAQTLFPVPGAGSPRLDQILADPELRSLLMDPDMQRVLQECGQPGKLQLYMRDPVMSAKLRKLAEAGLVQIQR